MKGKASVAAMTPKVITPRSGDYADVIAFREDIAFNQDTLDGWKSWLETSLDSAWRPTEWNGSTLLFTGERIASR